jgi:hypothetical protein
LYMCDWWSGESRFLPSQQLGRRGIGVRVSLGVVEV